MKPILSLDLMYLENMEAPGTDQQGGRDISPGW